MAKKKDDNETKEQHESSNSSEQIQEASGQTKDAKEIQSQESLKKVEGIFPFGAHFGIIQLPVDLMPKPSAQRIIQWVNDQEIGLRCYISENAYHRAELIEHYDRLMRKSYEQSISKGAINLFPLRNKIHWCQFTEEFCEKGKGPRIDPATHLPEKEE